LRDHADEGDQRSLSAQHLELIIKPMAERFSEVRRLGTLGRDYAERKAQFLRGIVSSKSEMDADWYQASVWVVLKIIEGEDIDLIQVDPSCYPTLEAVWLGCIKRLRAYYLWQCSDAGSPEGNYFRASGEIRRRLLESPRSPAHEFDRVRSYISGSYLTDSSPARLDEGKPAATALIRTKARRIYDNGGGAGPEADWARAKQYTRMFYENIIGAVVDDDELKTLGVLKAFQFSKCPQNRY